MGDENQTGVDTGSGETQQINPSPSCGRGVTAKAPRSHRFEQVPPEEADVLLNAALDFVLSTSSGALKELEEY